MHDGLFVNDRFYVTESGGNSVAWLEPDGRIISQPVEPSPYFVRGLCYTGRSFIVGFTTMRGTNLPAQLVEYDNTFTKQLDKMDVSSFYPPEIGTAIHSIVPAPPDADK
ncbi:MAG: hypothetical protein GY869_03320 [Planctomycetes bacterium]|nr:hypothetical protein [Planctomycetota bacterium]